MRKGFTLIELMIVIAIIAIIAAIAIPNLLKAKINANQTAAKTGCGTVMTEVQTADTSNDEMPDLKTLGDYVDPGLYANMAQHPADTTAAGTDVGTALNNGKTLANATGYKAYCFSYLVTTDLSGATPDPTTRGVEACPLKYKKGGVNAYYRTNEAGTTWQLDAATAHTVTEGAKTPFYTDMRYTSDIVAGGTWKAK